MVEAWRKDSNTVDILTGMPSYLPEEDVKKIHLNKVDITSFGRTERLKLFREKNRPSILRVFNALILIGNVFKNIVIKNRYDYVICSTTPPVLLAFSISLFKKFRNFKFIYHYMDIHPEIGVTAGHYNNRVVFRILRWMDKFAARSAHTCVVLSDDMKRSLLDRDSRLSASNVKIINNFGMSSKDFSRFKQVINYHSHGLNVVYAGNIGKFQSLDLLVDTARLLESVKSIKIHVVGDGAERERLEERVKDYGLENIEFYGQLPANEAQAAVASADLAYLSVSTSVLKYAFPSKLASYLAEGTPVIAMADEASELSKQLKSSEIGLVVPHDPKLLADVLVSLSENRSVIENMKLNLHKVGTEMFSKETYLGKWDLVLSGN